MQLKVNCLVIAIIIFLKLIDIDGNNKCLSKDYLLGFEINSNPAKVNKPLIINNSSPI